MNKNAEPNLLARPDALTTAESIQAVIEAGFAATRTFSPEQNTDFTEHLKKLGEAGKMPHKDFTFVLGDESNDHKITFFERTQESQQLV